MMNTKSRGLTTLGALTAAAALVAPVSAASSSPAPLLQSGTTTSSAAYCGISWGSLAKRSTSLAAGKLEDVRSGRHACFDRVVFDISPGAGRVGYSVRYVSQVASPGSGLPVPVNGGARIQVTVGGSATQRVPSSGVVNYWNWSTFRQLKWVGSYEGYTDFALGVRARLPMRAFVLSDADGGQRLVIDVAHRW